MYREFEKYILNNNLLQQHQKILIACSGGADSMCLLHLMQQLAACRQIKLAVCHVNHQLRATESEQDAAFVRNYCQTHGLEFELVAVQVQEFAKQQALSIEQAARHLRYQALYQVMSRLGCDLLATAHNKNDQVETFLLNMLRGAGIAGLKGMLPKQGNIIRPLLDTERSLIESFCVANNLSYCHDSSNDSHEYLRNRVRHELLPSLKEYNPNILETIAANMQNLRCDALYLEQQAKTIAATILQLHQNSAFPVVHINLGKFTKLNQAMATRVVLLAIENLLGHTQGINRKQLLKIYELAQEQSGAKQLKLPHGLLLKKTYTELTISFDAATIARTSPVVLNIQQTGHYSFSGAELSVTQEYHCSKPQSTASTLYIPLEIAQAGIIVRSRQSGDYFALKNGGRKTVKSFFIDQKISKEQREQVPLLYLGNKLLCIMGYRLISSEFSSTDQNYLVIKYKKNKI